MSSLSWASLKEKSVERYPSRVLVPPSRSSQIETCLAPILLLDELATHLVDDVVVRRREPGDDRLSESPVRVDDGFVVDRSSAGLSEKPTPATSLAICCWTTTAMRGDSTLESVLPLVDEHALVESRCETVFDRLLELVPANAQHGFVATGEGGRYQVFLGRGRAHREKRAFSQRRSCLRSSSRASCWFAVSARSEQRRFSSSQSVDQTSGSASVNAVHVADARIASNHGAKNSVVSTAPGGTGKPASAIRISE